MHSPKSLKIFIMVFEYKPSRSRSIRDTNYIVNESENCLITV